MILFLQDFTPGSSPKSFLDISPPADLCRMASDVSTTLPQWEQSNAPSASSVPQDVHFISISSSFFLCPLTGPLHKKPSASQGVSENCFLTCPNTYAPPATGKLPLFPYCATSHRPLILPEPSYRICQVLSMRQPCLVPGFVRRNSEAAGSATGVSKCRLRHL